MRILFVYYEDSKQEFDKKKKEQKEILIDQLLKNVE
jgi:hypothetical protein